MSSYAANTEVSTERSQQEIQQTLRRYGADEFQLGWSNDMAMIAFTVAGRLVRFTLPMPDRKSRAFQFTNHNPPRERTSKQVDEAYEQAIKQRWRALNLVIKAKLEAVEAKIVTFEQEFAMFTVMPDGRTVAEHVLPVMAQALESSDASPTLFPTLSLGQ